MSSNDVVTPRNRFALLVRGHADHVDDGDLSDDEILSRLADAEALTTQLMAAQSDLLLTLRRRRLDVQAEANDHPPDRCARGCCDPDGWVALEVAQALAITERQAGRRLDTAERLERYHEAAAAIRNGRLQVWTAITLLEHLDRLAFHVSAERLARIERATVEWLLDRPRTVSQLTARMRRLLLSVREQDDAERARQAAQRAVQVLPAGDDDLAMVVGHLPDGDAAAIGATLRALAADPVCAGDTRTRAAREADLFTSSLTGLRALHGFDADLDLIARSPGSMTVTLDVTIPADSLVGGQAPATIPGYGVVPATTGRDIARREGVDVRARPLVYDPVSGRLLGSPTAWLTHVVARVEHPVCRVCTSAGHGETGPAAGRHVSRSGMRPASPLVRLRPRRAVPARGDQRRQQLQPVSTAPPAQDARARVAARAGRRRSGHVDHTCGADSANRPCRLPPAGRSRALLASGRRSQTPP